MKSSSRRALKPAQEQEDRRWRRNQRDGARHAAETVEQRREGELLKLLVKDKLLYSGKVPMNVKEWQLRPLRREKQDCSG